MRPFKVGDKVRANTLSNEYYCITNEYNGWTGTVMEVDEDYISVTDGDGLYHVMVPCFDLIEEGGY